MINPDDLRSAASHVILHVGDMIYDIRTKSRGFLRKRERRIDIIEDDIYIWWITWFSEDESTEYNNVEFIEEEGLKMSVTIGLIEINSIKHGE
tara:strand:+ start:558 stop:836 length:279 start_codon:yes stop_codon:yes gene_type:complete